jgi:hypothetical protein
MSPISTCKIDRRIAQVIDQLRHGRTARQLISRESEANLKKLALMRPDQAIAFFRTLTRLDRLALPIEKIVVPAVLAEVQNRDVQRQLARMGFVGNLVCSNNGVLDLRKAGLKNELGYIDLTPKYQPLTLADYREIMAASMTRLQNDREMGNLFLFKSILRLRIELYIAGAERSKALARGENPGMTPDFVALKEFIDHLAKTFPFGTVTERQQVKEDLEIAAVLLGRMNNPAADAKLTGLFNDLEKIVSREVVERTRIKPKGMKVTYEGKGNWKVSTTGFRQTELGLMRKNQVFSKVRTPELLSMIDHILESIAAERDKNGSLMAQIAFVKYRYPDLWDKLFELHLQFTEYDSSKKEKATAEMEGALELARVGTEPALRTAKSLLTLAENDLEVRVNELRAQHEVFTALHARVEEELGRRLGDFDQAAVKKTEDRLGAYLGTFLKGEIREDWLRRAKSRVVGVKHALQKIRGRIAQKQHFIELTNLIRDNYRTEREQIWRSRVGPANKREQLEQLKKVALEGIKSNLTVIERINFDIRNGLTNAAAHLLLMKADFANRREKVLDPDDVRRSAPVFPLMEKELVAALDAEGNVLGKSYRWEAQAMGLRFREI